MTISIPTTKILDKCIKIKTLSLPLHSNCLRMDYIEVEHHDRPAEIGYLCQNDLFLHCYREESPTDDSFETIVDISRRRRIPQVDFTDEKLFPRMPTMRKNVDEDHIRAELNSMLAGREYIRKVNPSFDRKSSSSTRLDHKRKKFYRFHD